MGEGFVIQDVSPNDQAAPVVGFIGLGDMGAPMTRRLLEAGLTVVVWNRSPDKAQALVAEGAILADSPAEVGRRATLIGLCLTSHKAVEAVVFGQDGVLGGAAAGARRWIIDFSTGDPEVARDLAARAAKANAGWIDAPVSGGVPGATKGTLTVFAGGEAADLEALQPLLAPVSARVTHLGPSGAGQTAKICNQMIVACNVMMIAETIAVARKAGVEVDRLPEAFKGGFADSAPLQVFGGRMADHVFVPRLGAIGLMAKDLGLAQNLAAGVEGATPLLALCAKLYGLEGQDLVNTEDDLSKLVGLFEPL